MKFHSPSLTTITVAELDDVAINVSRETLRLFADPVFGTAVSDFLVEHDGRIIVTWPAHSTVKTSLSTEEFARVREEAIARLVEIDTTLA